MNSSTSALSGPRVITVTQGEFAVAGPEEVVISTILGSCVAVALWDETTRVGGLNHLLLPDDRVALSDPHAVSLMERLINGILKRGGRRGTLKAKAFGGADMLGIGSNIGSRNAAFAKEYLTREGIEIVAESLGGTLARRVRFWPATGEAQQRLVQEGVPAERPPRPRPANDVELF